MGLIRSTSVREGFGGLLKTFKDEEIHLSGPCFQFGLEVSCVSSVLLLGVFSPQATVGSQIECQGQKMEMGGGEGSMTGNCK